MCKSIDNKCTVLDCNDFVATILDQNGKEIKAECCEYHTYGGMFGTGESFERYQIIEADFLQFIRTIPLHEDHFSVYSNVLRDIILRACVEIEVFFKEWGRYEFTDKAGKFRLHVESIRKNGEQIQSKYWKIKDYYYFNSLYKPAVYVRHFGTAIDPFKNWTLKKPPKWWDAYNSIKHDGHLYYKKANYENALNSLAALFQLHCMQLFSLIYLRSITSNEFSHNGNPFRPSFRTVKNNVSTPVDSKLYLFYAYGTGGKLTSVFNQNTTERHMQIIGTLQYNV